MGVFFSSNFSPLLKKNNGTFVSPNVNFIGYGNMNLKIANRPIKPKIILGALLESAKRMADLKSFITIHYTSEVFT